MLELLYRYAKIIPRPLFELFEKFLWWRFWHQLEQIESKFAGVKVSGFRTSERGTLQEKLATFSPFESLLEIGCGFGQNFEVLSLMLQKPRYVGIDKNFGTIEEGKARLTRLGIGSRVELRTADVMSGLPFKDGEFEIAFTLASLLYVRNDQILFVVKEMLRVARRKLVMVEQHFENPHFSEQDLGVFVANEHDLSGYWLRDYRKLFERFVEPSRIQVQRIPQPRFQTEQWQKHAHMIIVDLGA